MPPNRKSHRRRRRRRIALLAAGAGFVLFVLAGSAYQQLQQERTRLLVVTEQVEGIVADPVVLRDPDARNDAVATLRAATTELEASRTRLAQSVGLRAIGLLPIASRQRAGVLDLIDDGAVAADTAGDVLERLHRISGTARLADGRLPLESMAEVQRVLSDGGERLGALVRSPGGLLGPLRTARGKLNATAREQGTRLDRVGRQLEAAAAFLGADGPRRYFLALENNAEMRARGMVLSFAELAFDGGEATVGHTASVDEILLDDPADIPIPPGTAEAFGALEPTRVWQSVNSTADFNFTGRAIQRMYEQATGTRVDGVIGIDVVGLARLLTVVGPVDLSGESQQLTADNVADVVLDQFYEDLPYGPQTVRRERLAEVAAIVTQRLTSGDYDLFALGDALGAAAAGRHLRLWSEEPTEEAAFTVAGVAGGVAGEHPERTFHISVQNATATKLDYFVRPSVSMEVIVTPAGAAVVRTTVTVRNNAPTDARSTYQFGPDRVNSFAPAEYVTRVYLWAPAGSTQLGSVEESGLQLVHLPTRALPGTSTSVTFETIIDDAVQDGVVRLRLVPQPRLVPVPLQVTLSAPGRTISGPATQRPEWSRDVTVSWRVG